MKISAEEGAATGVFFFMTLSLSHNCPYRGIRVSMQVARRKHRGGRALSTVKMVMHIFSTGGRGAVVDLDQKTTGSIPAFCCP